MYQFTVNIIAKYFILKLNKNIFYKYTLNIRNIYNPIQSDQSTQFNSISTILGRFGGKIY